MTQAGFVPVHLIQGRHELAGRTALLHDWLDALRAPHKQLIWFEQAGHSTAFEEFRRFHHLMIKRVVVSQT